MGNDAVVVALNAEIDALDTLISLQTQKLDALRKMRKQVMAGSSLSDEATTRTAAVDAGARASMIVPRLSDLVPDVVVESQVPAAISSFSTEIDNSHLDYLVKRGIISIEGNATASQVLTFQMVREGTCI